jgi:hypothetical protein
MYQQALGNSPKGRIAFAGLSSANSEHNSIGRVLVFQAGS